MLNLKSHPSTSEISFEIEITPKWISDLFRQIITSKFNDINEVVNEEDGPEGATFAGDIIYDIDNYLKEVDEPLDEEDLYAIVWELEELIKWYFDSRKEANLGTFQDLRDEFINKVEVLCPAKYRPYRFGDISERRSKLTEA